MKKVFKLILFIILLFPFCVKANTELPVDVLNMSIEEIQEAHSKGLFTYEQLVSFYLDRINEYNEQYNCIITINENALEQAKELDEKYKKHGLVSDLMGMPIVVKDNIDVYGMPTTNGTKALKDNYPNSDAEVIKKLRNAGVIIIAKTNMSEFAFSANNSRSSYGHTYNAYDTLYSPYGSSGGSATAVAAGLAVAGLGTDTNASVRTPSSANNVVGIRPTYGLLSGEGVIKYDITRDTVGVITRYISDNKLLLSIMSGKKFKNKNLKTIKVGVLTSWMKENSDSSLTALSSTYKEIVTLMDKAIDVLKNNNIEIVEINDFYSWYYENLVTSTYAGRTLCYEFNKYISNTKSKINSLNQMINSGGYIQDFSGYNEVCTKEESENYLNSLKPYKKEFKEYVDSIFEKYDVDILIYPTTKNKLLEISQTGIVDLKTNSYTIAPITGYPSINVQLGFDSDNLPYGMEMLSKENNEDLLYSLGSLYESNTNYYKVPSIAPNLYELPKNIDKLVKYYKSNKYSEINKEVRDFFVNYNNIENKEELIEEYISKYEEVKEKEEKKKNNYISIIVIIIIVVLMYKMLKKKKRRRKRRRY